MNCPSSLLPNTVSEGQVFQMSLEHDPDASQNERNKVEQKLSELSGDDDGEDFSL